MILLHAYDVPALLKAEAAATEVGALLRDDEPTALTTVGLAEVLGEAPEVARVLLERYDAARTPVLAAVGA